MKALQILTRKQHFEIAVAHATTIRTELLSDNLEERQEAFCPRTFTQQRFLVVSNSRFGDHVGGVSINHVQEQREKRAYVQNRAPPEEDVVVLAPQTTMDERVDVRNGSTTGF